MRYVQSDTTKASDLILDYILNSCIIDNPLQNLCDGRMFNIVRFLKIFPVSFNI